MKSGMIDLKELSDNFYLFGLNISRFFPDEKITEFVYTLFNTRLRLFSLPLEGFSL